MKVPQPVKGSVSLLIRNVPPGLNEGFYLDEDVALYICAKVVVIIAPDTKIASLVAENLPKAAYGWSKLKVDEVCLQKYHEEYDAWLVMIANKLTAGESDNECRESDIVAGERFRAAS